LPKGFPTKFSTLSLEAARESQAVMDEQFAEVMTGFPILQGFTSQGAQRLLERGEVRVCSMGEVLFKEGDPPAFVALVLGGKVQIFVEREGGDMILTDVGPGTILGELAVLCNIPRAASVRASEAATVLQWNAAAFRNLLLRYPLLSERIFKEALRTLVEKERALIDSVVRLAHSSDEASA
jgi:CRP/FNR family cyclic AMP-dependent transcriptional regulator